MSTEHASVSVSFEPPARIISPERNEPELGLSDGGKRRMVKDDGSRGIVNM